MTLKTIHTDALDALLNRGATVVDIREADEYRREHVPGAVNAPLSRIDDGPLPGAGVIIFHCRSGNRTAANAGRLAQVAGAREAYLLEGGIEAWRDTGRPIVKDKRQPIEIMRQVQIGAGSLVLLGVLLGALVHPGFYGLSGFVGAGLVFAGVTGFCGMARVLMLAPWNRRALVEQARA